jgi:diguanylate cyclase
MADGSAGGDSATRPLDPTAIARAALAAMGRNGVPPDPRNFAVWYTHCAGQRPDLSGAIEALLAAREPLTSLHNEELYVRFLTGEPDAAQLESLERLHTTVEQVLGTIDESRSVTRDYGRTLADCSVELDAVDRNGLRAAIARLVGGTKLMSERTRALEEQLRVSRDEIHELRESLVSLEREAQTDALTEIANRKSFDLRLRHAVATAWESGTELSLLLLDIDHFKQFNDTHGHQIGDQVLRLVAQGLTESVKGRDTAARFGGEEFAILLPQTPLDGAVAVAEQIRCLIMRRRIVRKSDGAVLGTVTLSAGAACYHSGEAADELIRRADRALYLAKAEGRNCVRDETALARQAVAAAG